MVLVAVYRKGKDGKMKIARKCDARCYNATGDKCTCVCGGKNHKQGLEMALKITKEHFNEIQESLEEEYPGRVKIVSDDGKED